VAGDLGYSDFRETRKGNDVMLGAEVAFGSDGINERRAVIEYEVLDDEPSDLNQFVFDSAHFGHSPLPITRACGTDQCGV
jgi:hypothetical protein